MTISELAQTVMDRAEALSKISDEPDRLTRTFASPAMRKANNLVAGWMSAAGMTVSENAIGNLTGHYRGNGEHAKTFILGSHLDTVRGAGRFDGALGVLIALACVEQFQAENKRLPFAIDVIGFADGDGVRFDTTCLGSRAMAGTLGAGELKKVDTKGASMADAIREFGGNPDRLESARRDRQDLLGFAEVHIEQGPVLEKKQQPVGIVTAIAGRTRARVRFTGQSGHAGTTPMAMRRDALVAAAQFILAVESCTRHYPGLVATIGQLDVQPGGFNVIPSEVLLHLDVRHQVDGARGVACTRLQETAGEVAEKRGVKACWETIEETQSVPCSRDLSDALARAARTHIVSVMELFSGAGHDAAAMADITPAAMLFVRCKGGLTHHPDESVRREDVEVAIAIMVDFLNILANQQNPLPPKKRS